MYEEVKEHYPTRGSVVVRKESFKKRYVDIVSEKYIYALFKVNESRTRATRIIGTNTPPGEWKLGSVIALIDLDSGLFLGDYKIVGVGETLGREFVGSFPKVATAYATFP